MGLGCVIDLDFYEPVCITTIKLLLRRTLVRSVIFLGIVQVPYGIQASSFLESSASPCTPSSIEGGEGSYAQPLFIQRFLLLSTLHLLVGRKCSAPTEPWFTWWILFLPRFRSYGAWRNIIHTILY
jgi:hypothetical protein